MVRIEENQERSNAVTQKIAVVLAVIASHILFLEIQRRGANQSLAHDSC